MAAKSSRRIALTAAALLTVACASRSNVRVVGSVGSAASRVDYVLSTFAHENDRSTAAWAGNHVNTTGFRANAVVSSEVPGQPGMWIQTVAWYRWDGYMMTARRTLPEGPWTIAKGFRILGVPNDPHNAISIAVDGQGILHAAYGMHAVPMRYWHGADPDDIAIGAPLKGPMVAGSTFEDKVTYPQLAPRLKNGDLLFQFRDGSSSSGDQILYRYDVNARAWRIVQAPWIVGKPGRNPYMSRIVRDRNDILHVAWMWRERASNDTSHDYHYARSSDQGATWTNIQGEALAMPITRASPTLAWAIPEGSGLINAPVLAVTDDGAPLIAGLWDVNADGVSQYSVVSWNGSDWFRQQAGVETARSSVAGLKDQQAKDLFRMLSQPSILRRGDDTYLVFRSAARGNVISVNVSHDKTLKSWTTLTLYPVDSGDMLPATWDEEHWRAFGQREGVAHFYHQFLKRDRSLGRGFKAGRSASVLEVKLPD